MEHEIEKEVQHGKTWAKKIADDEVIPEADDFDDDDSPHGSISYQRARIAAGDAYPRGRTRGFSPDNDLTGGLQAEFELQRVLGGWS